MKNALEEAIQFHRKKLETIENLVIEKSGNVEFENVDKLFLRISMLAEAAYQTVNSLLVYEDDEFKKAKLTLSLVHLKFVKNDVANSFRIASSAAKKNFLAKLAIQFTKEGLQD